MRVKVRGGGGEVRHDKVRQDKVRQGKVRQHLGRQHKVRQYQRRLDEIKVRSRSESEKVR